MRAKPQNSVVQLLCMIDLSCLWLQGWWLKLTEEVVTTFRDSTTKDVKLFQFLKYFGIDYVHQLKKRVVFTGDRLSQVRNV